jgi:hypothetical protein
MATPRNHRRARRAPSSPDAVPRGVGPVIAAIGFLLVYALIFFLAPIPELKDQEHPAGLSRGALLTKELLLFDDVVLGARDSEGVRVSGGWFGVPAEFAMGDRLRVLLPALAMLAVCGLAGWLLLNLARIDRGITSLETIFFSCCVGCSALSLYTFGVGLAGGLHARWLFLAPAAVIVLLGLYRLRRVFGSATTARDPDLSSGESAGEQQAVNHWLWWGVPFVAAIMLGGTLTPIEFDVLEYHLQAPKEFYQQGAIGFLPHNVYANMPLGSEMLSLAAISAVGDWWFGALVGKALIALAAPLTALGLLAAGRRFIDPTCGVVAALTYISIPWITRVSALGLVEGVSALYLWGTVYAMLLWLRRQMAERMSLVALAGFLAGSAAACKYPNVVFVLVPATLVVALRSWIVAARQEPTRRWSARFLSPACFLIAAFVACGPWFAKNWLLTGNPTYPLAYKIFDGRTRTDELDAQWNRVHRPPGFAPWRVFDSAANIAWRSSWLSPLVLPLAILGVLGTCHRRLAIGLCLYATFVFATWWLFTHRLDRFWVPIYPVLALLAGCSAARVATLGWHVPLKIFLAAGLAVNLLVIVAGGGGDNAYFVSLERLQKDTDRIHDWHQYLNDHLSRDDVVLAVADAVVFDLKMPVLYSTVFDQDLLEELTRGRTAEERRQALAELGVRYVVVDWSEIARYRSPGNYGFTDFITPALFEELVSQQVLDPPLRPGKLAETAPGYDIYPVQAASTASESSARPHSPERAPH